MAAANVEQLPGDPSVLPLVAPRNTSDRVCPLAAVGLSVGNKLGDCGVRAPPLSLSGIRARVPITGFLDEFDAGNDQQRRHRHREDRFVPPHCLRPHRRPQQQNDDRTDDDENPSILVRAARGKQRMNIPAQVVAWVVAVLFPLDYSRNRIFVGSVRIGPARRCDASFWPSGDDEFTIPTYGEPSHGARDSR